MRWHNHPKDNVYLGDTMIRSGFLFLPVKINNETRWLEFAAWEETYTQPDFIVDKFWEKTMWISK